MSDETLKPCPSCGGPAAFVQLGAMWRAGCARQNECHVAAYAPAFFTKGATAQLWNRRRSDDAHVRAEAAVERTRAIATWMKGLAVTARGHRDRMAHIPASWQSFDDWANRLEVLAEEMELEFAALPQSGSCEAVGDDRLGMPVIDLPEKATPEQLRAHNRALRAERRALLSEREEDHAERTRIDTEYLDESLALVAELEAVTADRDREKTRADWLSGAYDDEHKRLKRAEGQTGIAIRERDTLKDLVERLADHHESGIEIIHREVCGGRCGSADVNDPASCDDDCGDEMELVEEARAAITPAPAQGTETWSPGHLRFLERQSDAEFTPVGWRQEERADDLFKADLLERERYVWKVKAGGRRREYDWAYRRTQKGRDALAVSAASAASTKDTP